MKKDAFVFLAAMGFCAAAGTANATVFYINEFTVTENGQTYWRDTFSDGAPPVDQVTALVDVNLYDRAYPTVWSSADADTQLARVGVHGIGSSPEHTTYFRGVSYI